MSFCSAVSQYEQVIAPSGPVSLLCLRVQIDSFYILIQDRSKFLYSVQSLDQSNNDGEEEKARVTFQFAEGSTRCRLGQVARVPGELEEDETPKRDAN